MVKPFSIRGKMFDFGVRGCYRHGPEVRGCYRHGQETLKLKIQKMKRRFCLPTSRLEAQPAGVAGGERRERQRGCTAHIYNACLEVL